MHFYHYNLLFSVTEILSRQLKVIALAETEVKLEYKNLYSQARGLFTIAVCFFSLSSFSET